jgi:RNA polymerase sigma factor (sigma-70 family)
MTTIETNALIEQYMPLADKLAIAKFYKTPKHISLEELKSAAYLGLVEAANRITPEKIKTSSYYLKRKIYWAMQDYLRSLRWSISDNYVSFEDTQSKEEDLDFLIFVEEVLNGIAKEVLISYYVYKESQKDIAETYDLTIGRISQILDESRNVMKQKLVA